MGQITLRLWDVLAEAAEGLTREEWFHAGEGFIDSGDAYRMGLTKNKKSGLDHDEIEQIGKRKLFSDRSYGLIRSGYVAKDSDDRYRVTRQPVGAGVLSAGRRDALNLRLRDHRRTELDGSWANLFPDATADELGELEDSMRKLGFVEGLPVLTYDGGLLDGRQRAKVAASLDLEPVEHEMVGLDEMEAVRLALASNFGRRQLSKVRRNRMWKRLHDLGFSYREIGDMTGTDPSTVRKAASREGEENSPPLATPDDSKESEETTPSTTDEPAESEAKPKPPKKAPAASAKEPEPVPEEPAAEPPTASWSETEESSATVRMIRYRTGVRSKLTPDEAADLAFYLASKITRGFRDKDGHVGPTRSGSRSAQKQFTEFRNEFGSRGKSDDWETDVAIVCDLLLMSQDRR